MKEFIGKINFFVTGFVSILGFTLIYEVISENDVSDKIDDLLMLVLGIVAILWYKKSWHKGISAIPAIVVSGLAVCIKIMAIVIEHADKEAVGDDIGIFISLLMLFIFTTWQVLSHKKSSK
jgi:hypothetical protein